MLVLTRKVNEKVLIGDNIEIVVLQVRGDRVRLGFSAPNEVQIHREEVRQRIQQEQSHRAKLPIQQCFEVTATDVNNTPIAMAASNPVMPEVLR